MLSIKFNHQQIVFKYIEKTLQNILISRITKAMNNKF